jgi:Mor family transcriptional regulator
MSWNEKKKRNKGIIEDKKGGMSIMDICIKHGKITPSRVYAILRRYKVKKGNK